ncbi:MAG: DUF402 domain-containing protein [Thaumarchaeota archaeon]|nr:DUF402 domain-containing protein [Nitrososphaerota archaeon]
MRISIRGIYSTALILLLKEAGFTIVNPTRSQTQRFGITIRDEADAMITGSSMDRSCIEVKGLAEVVREVVDFLRKNFHDLIILNRFSKDSFEKVRAAFPNESKFKLDELRSKVSYTVPYHHYCRAGGEGLSSMVSFAEDLVERGLVPADEMSKMFEEQVSQMVPRLGVAVKIIHVKTFGKRIALGSYKVVRKEEEKVLLQKRILSPGTYDGLNVEKSPGDYAVVEVERFRPWTKTSYYSISGELKGHYYNISTPVSVYPDHVHYFDLEIDVAVKPNSEAEIIDADLLDKAVEENRIRKELRDEALRIAEELASKQP